MLARSPTHLGPVIQSSDTPLVDQIFLNEGGIFRGQSVCPFIAPETYCARATVPYRNDISGTSRRAGGRKQLGPARFDCEGLVIHGAMLKASAQHYMRHAKRSGNYGEAFALSTVSPPIHANDHPTTLIRNLRNPDTVLNAMRIVGRRIPPEEMRNASVGIAECQRLCYLTFYD